MRIAVVGAGIGGLALAAGLQARGADVFVLESSPTLRSAGTAITLAPNALRALESLGYGEALARHPHAVRSDVAAQRSPDGRTLTLLPSEILSRTRVMTRQDLHLMLASRVTPGRIRLGCRVESVSTAGTVRFTDGDGVARTWAFDLVVGADGSRSAVRRAWPDDPGLQDAGYSAWRAVTREPVDLTGPDGLEAAGETWGDGSRFGFAPLADGRAYWFAVQTNAVMNRHDDERHLPSDRLLTRLAAHFESWHAPIPQLIAATDPEDMHFTRVTELAADLPTFSQGRLVLLGDAAHAMTPNLGQGGAQALEDAATLAICLDHLLGEPPGLVSTDRLRRALERYATLRQPRIREIARLSRNVGRIAHLRMPGAAALRNLALRRLPDSRINASLRQIADWRPPPATGR
jgi:2-polyprenyl-6-methoxyphenol hydroxylase-like FAD-dependent oxidoreductase